MQGDLADASPVDLCLQLAAQATTGTLVLSAAAGTAELVLVDGRLAGGRAPATSPHAARLGERLVSIGRLTPSDLEAALVAQADDDRSLPLGQRLVDAGLVDADVVRLALQEQALDTLQEVAGWFEGSFRLRPDTALAGVRVSMPVDRALREVDRRTRDRGDLALQAVGQPADKQSTAPSREEFDLSASPSTGTRPAALADAGWADRLDTTPAPPDEPEPWVGWADASRHGGTAATGQAPASAPAAPPQPPPHPEPTAPATRTYVPSSDVPGSDAEPPPASPSVEPAADASEPAPPVAPEPPRAATPLDADTRRELFSELHEMGRATPARAEPAPPNASRGPEPGPDAHLPGSSQPEVEVEGQPATEGSSQVTDGAEGSDELDIEPPAPPPSSLSRSDVSELLAELHALNLDD